MTDRKFTPPTEFPAEYVGRDGNKLVVLGRSDHKNYPLIGFDHTGCARAWSEYGTVFRDLSSIADLHDIPKRITTWHNLYKAYLSPSYRSRSEADRASTRNRLCVIRLEYDEDGGNFKTFTEEA